MKKVILLLAFGVFLFAGCSAEDLPDTTPTDMIDMADYTFSFSYEAEFESESRLKITMRVTNVGKDFSFTGTPYDQFSVPILSYKEGNALYEIGHREKVNTDDATRRTFCTGETYSITEYIEIPENAPIGVYDVVFWFHGKEARFETAVEITKDYDKGDIP